MSPDVVPWTKPVRNPARKSILARYGHGDKAPVKAASGHRHQRSIEKLNSPLGIPDTVLQRIIAYISPDDLRTAVRLAACSRQLHRAVMADPGFGRRLYRAAYLLGAHEERDWLRWWLKDSVTSLANVNAMEVSWQQVFLSRRQLEVAWRSGGLPEERTATSMKTMPPPPPETAPLRPRLREVILPVERGERVNILASGAAGTILRVAREGRVIVVEHRSNASPRSYELSDKGMQGIPGVLTTPPPRVLRGRGARRFGLGAARIPGVADARINDRFVVLLVADSIAAAVTDGASLPVPSGAGSMFVTPRHTLCVWKTGHQHMAYRVDGFDASRLTELRGRWLVTPRSTHGSNSAASTGSLGSPLSAGAHNGYTVYDLARNAMEVGNFGSSFGHGCVQASDDRSLLVYACGVVGHRQQMLWEQWSVRSRNSTNNDPSPMKHNGKRRVSRTGMLPIEGVDRDTLRVYSVDADSVLVVYTQSKDAAGATVAHNQRRSRVALHSTRYNTLVWDRELARHRDLHSVEVFSEAGIAQFFLHPDADIGGSLSAANAASVDIDSLAPPRCLALSLATGLPSYQCHWPWASTRPSHVLGSIAVVSNEEGRRCLIDVATGHALRWLWPSEWEEPMPVEASKTTTTTTAGSPKTRTQHLCAPTPPTHAPHSRTMSPRLSPLIAPQTAQSPQLTALDAALRSGSPLNSLVIPSTTQLFNRMHVRDDELCVTPTFTGRIDRYGGRYLVLDYTRRPPRNQAREEATAPLRKRAVSFRE
ncbi:hypothetical protein SYNPS1DRAFT_28477 [Syncephalis pseudoplumigaleata]|uniref:F-box domain-containing protein n=1 Tax=Syncephalis pseudoplumigaleata TaxID=1712513 RepID=A0A4P9Z2U5_9FUNG|nr:hypothetical protein SYNPS1DRAFT_28477 [Syncephalis pseudoplumigaleata]|eukprot:RKP25800.1 hypothetical protein SYNPS1DRAFT_28477 [Syncephalis pseudoplumigaleata]